MPDRRRLLTGCLLLVLFGVSWGSLLFQAHYYWGSASYYNFGWFVPLLFGFLLHRRMENGLQGQSGSPSRLALAVFIPGLLAAVAAITVFRLFSEANPYWRVPLWGHALVLMGVTALGIFLFSGLKGIRHLLFPFCFLLLAIPWPWRFEQAVIQTFTGWVTEVTTFCLNMVGYPAVSTGNVILIDSIRLGVEEACSGIRSLQALVMIALFIGEYYFFGFFRRLLLFAASIALVMCFNGLRALSLALITVGDNPGSFQFWHDFLGNFNFIGSGLLLFLFGEGLNRLQGRTPPPERAVQWKQPSARLTLALAGMVAGAFLLAEASVEGYYRWQESRTQALPELALQWDEARSLSVQSAPIPEAVQDVLKYDYGTQVHLSWDDGLTASALHYGYTGDNKIDSVSSFGHSPEICVTAMGGRLVSRKEPLELLLNGIPWQMEHLEFAFGSPDQAIPATMQVFWLVWEPHNMGVAAAELKSLSWRNQLKLVRHGRRDFRRQVFLIQFPEARPDPLLRNRLEVLLSQISRAASPGAGSPPDRS